MKRFLVVAIVLGLAVLAIPNAMARDGDGVKVIDRDSVVYGRTYGDWMAAWDQWSYSLPVTTHPLFTDGDCSVGQSGPVWFLGGAFVPPWTRVRHCSIPSGTALFFPVWDWEDSAVEESTSEHPGDPTYQQIATLRSNVFQLLNQYLNPLEFLAIDNKQIRDLLQDFRIQSTVFGFTIPDNNLLSAVYGTTYPAGTYFPAVDDGWDVMLAPLPPGDHVVVFGVAGGDTITYYLHVAWK
jgi:hypothetical protein